MAAWEEKHVMGKVLYEFKAAGQFQVDLAAGETVEILKQSSGWFRGRVIGREAKGIFPVSFIELRPEEPFPPPATPAAAAAPAAAKPAPPAQPAAAAATPAATPAAAAAATPVAAASPAKGPPPLASASTATPAAAAPAAAASPAAATTGSAVSNSPFLKRAPSSDATVAASAAPAASPAAAGSSAPVKKWAPVDTSDREVLKAEPNAAPVAATAPPPVKQWPPAVAGGQPPPPAGAPPKAAAAGAPGSPPPPVRPFPPAAGVAAGGPPPPPPAAAAPPATAAAVDPASPVPSRPLPGRAPPPMDTSASAAGSAAPADPLLSPSKNPNAANSSRTFHTSHRFSITDSSKSKGVGLLPPPLNTAAGPTVEPEGVSDNPKLKDNMSLESLLAEMDHTVRDWSVAMRAALVLGNMLEHHRGMERLSALLECRRRLQFETDESVRAIIRHEIIEMIEGSRKMAEGYMVPRNAAGQVADSNNTGVVELLTLHRSMYSALKEESSSVWIAKGTERKLKSFKKQEMEALRNAEKIASSTPGGEGGPPTPSSAASSTAASSSASAPVRPSISSNNAGANGAAGASASSADGGALPGQVRPAAAAAGKKFPAGPLQLYLNVKMCIFSVGEATDLFFSLYSASESKFVTEEYSLALSDQGLPLNLALLHKMRTVFTDLSARDFEKDLWLVCRIYRKGRLVFDTAKAKSPQRLYRRPFGCAACSLTESNIDSMVGKEYEPPNAAMTIYTCGDESKFSRIHELIIARDRSLEPAPRAKGIALGLILYTGDLDTVRRNYPETMSADSTPVSRKLRFPDRLSPGDMRNDLYVHLLAASFSQDGKKSAKNIEMALRVVIDDGTSIENCISHGKADLTPVTEYHSTVYYHLNTPFYAETVRLSIPENLMERNCHLFISFWHVSTSKKISCFSFSFLPLCTEHGNVIPDAEYKLPAFKAFPKIEAGPAGSGSGAFYLQGENSKTKLEARKEFLCVRTQSLSTVKTQNLILHNMFKHTLVPSGGARGLMERFISGLLVSNLPELVRFLREILDTLFCMLANPTYVREQEWIFRALLHMLVITTDKAASLPGTYGPVPTWDLVDEYIQTLFLTSTKYAQPFAALHPILIKLTSNLLSNATNMAVSKEPPSTPAEAAAADHSLLKLTKCLHYVLKIIIRSREIEVRLAGGTMKPPVIPGSAAAATAAAAATPTAASAAADAKQDAFKKNLVSLLAQVNRLVAAESRDELNGQIPSVIGSGIPPSPTQFVLPAQGFLVRSFPESITDLLSIFSLRELAEIARELIQALPRHSVQNVNKLHLLRNVLASVLGDHAASRDVLFPVAIQNLQWHLMAIDGGGLGEPYVCIAILNHMLDVISKAELASKAEAAAGGAGTEASAASSTNISQFVPLLQPIVHVALAIQQNSLASGGAGGAVAAAAGAVAPVAGGSAAAAVVGPSIFPALRAPSDAILAAIHIDVVVDSITILWTLLSLLSGAQIDAFIAGLSDIVPAGAPQGTRTELQSFLVDFLAVCSNSLQQRCYPDLWIVMNMMECTTITRMLAHLSDPIRKKCLASASGSAQLAAGASPAPRTQPLGPSGPRVVNEYILRAFFSMIVGMLMYDQLQIELFPPRKKVFVAQRYGDMRSALIDQFRAVWDSLGQEKLKYMDEVLIVKLFDLARGQGKEEEQNSSNNGSNNAAGPSSATASPAITPAKPALTPSQISSGEQLLTPKSGGHLTALLSGAVTASNPQDEGHAAREFALTIYFDMLVSSFLIHKNSGAGSSAAVANGTASGSSAAGSSSVSKSSSQAGDAFTQVERHTIDALYSLANLNQDAGRRIMELLYSTVSARFEEYTGPQSDQIKKEGQEFLMHIARMYELMSSLLKFPDTPLFEDERTSVALKLMHYLESSGHVRKDMYLRYTMYLVDLHVGLKNFTEAGCTSVQALRMLEWSETPLASLESSLTKYPSELERERKEKLYAGAIGYFKAGEDWERALAMAEELRAYYQFDAYDYPKLASLLTEQSENFRQIVSVERFYSNYFRVVYYGAGFEDELVLNSASGVRNHETERCPAGKEKEFVYKGVKLEPVMDFTNRIKRKWPEAKILMSSDRPTEELLGAHKQIISITTLTRATPTEAAETLKALGASPTALGNSATSGPLIPLTVGGPQGSNDVLSGRRPAFAPLPKNVATYREHNDLSVFIYAKGLQKDKKNANEFRHLWVQKTSIVTQESFPSNRRRMEVKSRREVLVSPIENAIQTMKNKNAELREKVAVVASAPPGPVDVGPLSMNLNGMIDAAVNGGTNKYIEAFLSAKYIEENPGAEAAELAARQQVELKESISEQIAELKVGLDVFGKRCDEKLKGLYDHLCGFYATMKAKTATLLA